MFSWLLCRTPLHASCCTPREPGWLLACSGFCASSAFTDAPGCILSLLEGGFLILPCCTE